MTKDRWIALLMDVMADEYFSLHETYEASGLEELPTSGSSGTS